MSEITMGGKHHQTKTGEANAQNLNATVVANNPEVPSEFIDTEFLVPTDDITLPSEGVFYPNKQKSVKVKYLTAEEENILTSTELIRNGKVLDVLLESAIIDKTLRPDNMLTGDRNYLLIKIRENSYGDDYSVKMTCPKCKEDYETSVKLSELKIKPLTVMPDANGLFDVTLPKMKLALKFRLLTGKDEAYLTKKSETSKKLKSNVQYSTTLTDRYLLQIMDINGNTDKGYIKKAISSFPISDSLFLRLYIGEVDMGVNMESQFECKNCGHTYLDETPINSKLFWPNSKL